MIVPVRDLLSLGDMPSHRTTATEWVQRKGVRTSYKSGNGGKIECVELADLPAPVREVYIPRLANEAGVDMGVYDDHAYSELLTAPAKVKDRAASNVVKLLFVAKQERLGLTWVATEKAGKKAFGSFVSGNTVKNWKALTKGIAPSNRAPALAPKWTGAGTGDPVSAEASARLVVLAKLGGKNGTGFPLNKAYNMVAKDAEVEGWDWPKLHTVRRHWNSMDPYERMYTELGEERTKALLTQYMPQCLTSALMGPNRAIF